MTTRPWQVLYSPDSGSRARYRSVSFRLEADAREWAKDYVRRSGDLAHAHVHRKPTDNDPQPDPAPAEYEVRWINGALSTRTWPEMPKAQRDQWVRQMMGGMVEADAAYRGPRWIAEEFERGRGPLPGPRRERH